MSICFLEIPEMKMSIKLFFPTKLEVSCFDPSKYKKQPHTLASRGLKSFYEDVSAIDDFLDLCIIDEKVLLAVHTLC